MNDSPGGSEHCHEQEYRADSDLALPQRRNVNGSPEACGEYGDDEIREESGFVWHHASNYNRQHTKKPRNSRGANPG